MYLTIFFIVSHCIQLTAGHRKVRVRTLYFYGSILRELRIECRNLIKIKQEELNNSSVWESNLQPSRLQSYGVRLRHDGLDFSNLNLVLAIALLVNHDRLHIFIF